ncbi:hypothetical protein PN437_12785 [Microcystis aeruginosa CS-564/01]|nr:hypothetical protein [Microcystis aeruginosa]MDB9425758.1 hypothetical protein [Microcystis aeruginosa CS-564/01]
MNPDYPTSLYGDGSYEKWRSLVGNKWRRLWKKSPQNWAKYQI